MAANGTKSEDSLRPYKTTKDSAYANDIEPLYTIQDEGSKSNPISTFIDSFKPLEFDEEEYEVSNLTPTERIEIATARHPLARKLKSRHLQMIAIGGSIGTGLFVGSGYALANGGPAAVLIGYTIVGYALLCVVFALGEMSVQFPVSGSFNAFFSRFVDPSWGFALGIMYACSWMISYPSELIACALTVQYWNTEINGAVWIAVFWSVIAIINLFGVKGFAEVEFVLSLIKVLAVILFIIVSITIICGVGDQGYRGGRYWHDPGAFNHGFKGVCSVFVSAAFSFGGIELVALTAAETENPRKSLPKATKQVFWRIFIFYIMTAIVIGCLVPYTNPLLLNGDGISASPFVIAITAGGINVLPHVMNAVILLAVVSVGNASVYGFSRSLCSLAAQGLVPSIFGYIDKAGRPIVSVAFIKVVGLLGFLVISENESIVFTWFFSVCSLAAFFTWAAICFTHLRWRWALDAQGRSLDEVAFVSPMGTWGSYSGLIILGLIVMGEIWVSIWPIGSSSANVVQFWQNCLSLPILILMIVGHKTYYGTWGQLMVNLEEVDLDSGRSELNVEQLKQEIADERAELREMPLWKRIYKFWC
ncbi:SAM3 [[Candida] subhashii]|uniref:SAM3 n=1 Tax=[Candida] subhashii TaxID=561895 RepID=A0A8J5V0H7_9ASCO|nr:SAM3 [[Candida] subhashii]KAG7665465.1 SAM3 [[Candida] subhashii]